MMSILFINPKNSMHAVDPIPGTAATAGVPFVTRKSCVIKIVASRLLQYISADRSHIPQLSRRTCIQGHGEQRMFLQDGFMCGHFAVQRQCANAEEVSFL